MSRCGRCAWCHVSAKERSEPQPWRKCVGEGEIGKGEGRGGVGDHAPPSKAWVGKSDEMRGKVKTGRGGGWWMTHW